FRFLFSLGGLSLAANLLRARRLVPREESFSYVIDLRRMGSRTALAFAGQGGVDGLLSVATPLGSFLLTRDSFALGLLFALFSLAAGIAAVVLGRVSSSEGPESLSPPGTGPFRPCVPPRVRIAGPRILRLRHRLALDDIRGCAVIHLHD